MLKDEKVTKLVEMAQSPEPNPGGGGISAIVGALAASLNIMVYKLTIEKKDFQALSMEVKDRMHSNIEDMKISIAKLEDYLTTDGRAFDIVLKAFKLPKDNEDQISFRKHEIEAGYMEAVRSPFEIAEENLKILRVVEDFARYGTLIAVTDISTSVILLEASVQAALWNVTSNLKGLPDKSKRASLYKMEEIRKEATKLRDEALEIIRGRV